jgi:hypothetical protein
VHTAETSNAAIPVRPNLAATSGAVAGHGRSGVVVASTSAWTSPLPADSSALVPASTARSDVVIPAVTTRRVEMPVRLRIHSSDVFSCAHRSALVTTRGGSQ